MSTIFKPKLKKDNKIEIYTDGACRSSATKKGSSVGEYDKSAYGFFLKFGGLEKVGGKAEYGRTNNYMELKAVVEALKAIKDGKSYPVVIYSDSKYVVDSISKKWMQGWKNRGWVKGDGKPPINVELWKELSEQLGRFPFINIEHVKGHSGIDGNELVDTYINTLMDELPDYEKKKELTFDEAHDAWVNKKEKTKEHALVILQEVYGELTNENFHSAVEAIELLTGVESYS